jgi:hypothetical protein
MLAVLLGTEARGVLVEVSESSDGEVSAGHSVSAVRAPPLRKFS